MVKQTKLLDPRGWEDAVAADLDSLGYSVTRLGDSIPPEVRQAVEGTGAFSVRYTADFLAKRGSDVLYVDAKCTGDIHYWAGKTPPHLHLVGRDQHDHYLRVTRGERIPFLYAFPCGRLCGYTGQGTDRYPHPSYMHVETFDRLISNHAASEINLAPYEVLHDDDHCLTTPKGAARFAAPAPARHLPYALETT